MASPAGGCGTRVQALCGLACLSGAGATKVRVHVSVGHVRRPCVANQGQRGGSCGRVLKMGAGHVGGRAEVSVGDAGALKAIHVDKDSV